MARKRGMQYIPYDYEAAYNKAMEDMHEWFIENLFQHRKKVIYALKEITAGDQFEIEIYPQFRSMDEVPPEGRTIKKDNNKAQKNLNDKNARKYVERLINENFSDRDIWMTLTYDDEHLPPDGDVDAAIKNVQKYIRRINYQRKKRGLPNISRGGASYNGSEQHSDRPAVVVSNNKNNENSNVVEVVYMTTQPKTDLPTHVTVRSTGRISTVLCEQVYSVSTERVGTYIGECTDKEMENIDIALMISLQLDGGIKTTKKYNETIKEQQEEIDSLKREIEMLQQEHEDTIAEIEQDAAVYVEEREA